MEQIKILNEYYDNLDYYNISDKEKALNEIFKLARTVRFDKNVKFLDRLQQLMDIIQKNILLFNSVCRHVDVVGTILEYISDYIATPKCKELDDSYQMSQFVSPLLTFFNMCKEAAIQSFLLYPLFTNSTWNAVRIHSQINSWLSLINLEREMIILKDSDLYALINCLIITDDFSLNKIWVQEEVKEKFLWLMKRYSLNFTINTFQLLKDIQFDSSYDYATINILSIWSQDIVAMKNLAFSLNSIHIIFINTYMDFSGTVAHFPYKELVAQAANQQKLNEMYFKKSDSTGTKKSKNIVHFSKIGEMNFTSIYKLFYDGTWQEPVKRMYWKHNDNLWANATSEDIIRCYESAEMGFGIWSAKSIKIRIQILSKLASILKLNGKSVLAAIVTRWLKFPYLFDTVQGNLHQNRLTETLYIRKPIGVIILREENENVLFFRLMQTLIAGNSVIAMFHANFCNLTSYCDMFSTCGIPPGVINLLSCEDINILEHKLCSTNYTKYADDIFLSKGNSMDTYIEPYKNLTICRSIILHFQ